MVDNGSTWLGRVFVEQESKILCHQSKRGTGYRRVERGRWLPGESLRGSRHRSRICVGLWRAGTGRA